MRGANLKNICAKEDCCNPLSDDKDIVVVMSPIGPVFVHLCSQHSTEMKRANMLIRLERLKRDSKN